MRALLTPAPGSEEAPILEPALAALLLARRKWSGQAVPLHYDRPVEVARGEGVYLFDTAGHRYLDMTNDISLVGHGHPEVVSAIAAQAATLNIHARYLNKVTDDYAARLLARFPAGLGNLVMTSTGSEANDLALRIARAVTGRKGIIVTGAAFHGSTAASSEISPGLLPSADLPSYVVTVPAPDSALAGSVPLGAWYGARIREAVVALARNGVGTAALVLDSVFSSDGVFTDPPGFLGEAVAVVRAAGGLFVANEGQAGFGRLGSGMWGFMRHGVVPDIVTLGKPMGNGYPAGGVVTRPEYLLDFQVRTPYLSSFGGSSVAAAGLAVLDVIEGEGLIRNAARTGGVLRKGLKALAKSFPRIGAVRGVGLLAGVDLVDPETGAPDPAGARRVVNALRQNFVLAGMAGPLGHTLRIRPPLCFDAGHVTHFLEIFRAVLVSQG
ncbi:aspartate aminotransferase family protein [Acidocella sp.]|uniref:aspartate aminotransferase family protein n=1 Tax=Acidocella sp. TaxID=50710 RepID=UPI003CFBC628